MKEILFTANRKDNGKQVKGYYCKWEHKETSYWQTLTVKTDCIIEVKPDGEMIRHVIDPKSLHRCDRQVAAKIVRKILFPLKCTAAVLLSPLLLFAVGVLLVMNCESEMVD